VPSKKPPSSPASSRKASPAELPMRVLLDQIADKWSVLVLAELCHGPLRFNELKRRLVGVSQKSLTSCLRTLEKNGIVSRTILLATPIAVQYEITPLGRTLEGPFAALHAWTAEHLAEVQKARASYEQASEG
jgi:DNA-binding HxlR family transcriptional regulator